MIVDLTKRYATRDGREVELYDIVEFNSAGDRVTFPIKGNIITRTPAGRRRTAYTIWKRNGRADIFRESPDDLIEINA